MTFDAPHLRAEHERQINMLLADDVEGLWNYHATWLSTRDLFNREIAKSGLHHTVWAFTGPDPRSLFADLPNCGHCLTQVKAGLDEPIHTDSLAASLAQAARFLNLGDLLHDDLVPNPQPNCRFSKMELQAMSGWQITARLKAAEVTP